MTLVLFEEGGDMETVVLVVEDDEDGDCDGDVDDTVVVVVGAEVDGDELEDGC